MTRIQRIYSIFPELQEKKIICGILKKKYCIEGTAKGWTDPAVVRLRTNVSIYTIAHEFTHLIQGSISGIPHGEIACDIWTNNRLPVELLDEPPYYLMRSYNSHSDWNRSKGRVEELCAQAINIRKTRRTYFVWLKGRIKTL